MVRKVKPQPVKRGNVIQTKKGSVSEKPRHRKARSSRKVNLKQHQRVQSSDSEIEMEDGDFAPVPRKGEVGKKGKALPIIKGREGSICPKCSLRHKDPEDPLPEETRWVFCPVCEVVVHNNMHGYGLCV